MPYSIKAEWNSRDVHALLAALAPRQWQFATALALTRTAGHVRTAEIQEMRTVFDRPTPFTLNSLRTERATRDQLHARVWFRDRNLTDDRHYLDPQVHGGERRDKRFERALQLKGHLTKGKQLVPASGAPTDAYGNVRRGLHSRVLSQLRAQRDPTANETDRSRRRNRRKLAGRYFYGNPGGRGWGVWERIGGGRVLGGRMGNRLVPVFLEQRKNQYRPRFAFFAVAERVAGNHIQGEFSKAADHTIRTAR